MSIQSENNSKKAKLRRKTPPPRHISFTGNVIAKGNIGSSTSILKRKTAERLAKYHFQSEKSIETIFLYESKSSRYALSDPIKLLEINPETVSSGIVPVHFGTTSEIHFPSIVVEITPSELQDISNGLLTLPQGWDLKVAKYKRRP